MTSLTLAAAATGISLPPFYIAPGARWWREALLRSPFSRVARGREGLTSADAVIGHFDRRRKTKRGIQIRSNATQFDVIEAKINSPLSGNVTNAADFDQVFRTVACIAFELEKSGADIDSLTSVGFYVISSQECLGTHRYLVTRENVERKLLQRIRDCDESGRSGLQTWYDGLLRRVLEKIKMECVSWESVLGRANQQAPEQAAHLAVFYQQCRLLAQRAVDG